MSSSALTFHCREKEHITQPAQHLELQTHGLMWNISVGGKIQSEIGVCWSMNVLMQEKKMMGVEAWHYKQVSSSTGRLAEAEGHVCRSLLLYFFSFIYFVESLKLNVKCLECECVIWFPEIHLRIKSVCSQSQLVTHRKAWDIK